MNTIDKDVLAAYNAGIEKGRLHTDLGLVEFERTKEILKQTLPSPPAVIYDIGGGYGEYSFWLASLGYEVYSNEARKHYACCANVRKRRKHHGIVNAFTVYFKKRGVTTAIWRAKRIEHAEPYIDFKGRAVP